MTDPNAAQFANASTRLESDGVHWTGTFAAIAKAALGGLLADAPIDVIVRRTFGTDDRTVYLPVNVRAVDGNTIRGVHQRTGDEVAIEVAHVTGIAF